MRSIVIPSHPIEFTFNNYQKDPLQEDSLQEMYLTHYYINSGIEQLKVTLSNIYIRQGNLQNSIYSEFSKVSTDEGIQNLLGMFSRIGKTNDLNEKMNLAEETERQFLLLKDGLIIDPPSLKEELQNLFRQYSIELRKERSISQQLRKQLKCLKQLNLKIKEHEQLSPKEIAKRNIKINMHKAFMNTRRAPIIGLTPEDKIKRMKIIK
jgi:hypothetical protein